MRVDVRNMDGTEPVARYFGEEEKPPLNPAGTPGTARRESDNFMVQENRWSLQGLTKSSVPILISAVAPVNLVIIDVWEEWEGVSATSTGPTNRVQLGTSGAETGHTVRRFLPYLNVLNTPTEERVSKEV